jgi:hypothetical protein
MVALSHVQRSVWWAEGLTWLLEIANTSRWSLTGYLIEKISRGRQHLCLPLIFTYFCGAHRLPEAGAG